MILFFIIFLSIFCSGVDECSSHTDCLSCITNESCGWFAPSNGGSKSWKFSCVEGDEWNCKSPECSKPHLYYHDYCPYSLHAPLYDRRSIRKYLDVPLSKEILHQLATDATWAPSCEDYEPWRFYVNISDFVHRGFDIWHGAPAAVIMFVEPVGGCEYANNIDGSLAMQNLMLSAFNYGLGTCPIGQARGAEPVIRQMLKIPEIGYHYVLSVAIGYPAEKNEKTRKPPKIEFFE